MKETIGNGLDSIIAQAIEEMKAEQGTSFQLEHLNLAELERRTGISRARLRRLQKTGFVYVQSGLRFRIRRPGKTCLFPSIRPFRFKLKKPCA